MENKLKISDTNANILFNFKENKKSNAECIFIREFDTALIEYLQDSLKSFQTHDSLNAFFKAPLVEPFHFIDAHDIGIIDETSSTILFR